MAMTDYKSMYYHLAGRTATAVDILEATISIMEANAEVMISSAESMKASVASLTALKEKLKHAQQATESMFLIGDDTEK